MIREEKYEKARKHFLLWYESCGSSCFDFGKFVIHFLEKDVFDIDESSAFIERISFELTYEEKSQIMLDLFFQKKILNQDFSIKEIQPYYEKINSSSSLKLKRGWSELMIFLLEKNFQRKRSDVENVFNFIRVWNIDFDYQKLGKLSPHSDLKNFILSWGNYKSSKVKDAKKNLKDWDEEGIANYHFLEYHSLNSRISSSLGQTEEALASLEKMAISGGGEDGVYRKAGYLFYLGLFDDAEKEYKRYLNRYPEGPRADLCKYHLFRLNAIKNPNIALSYISEIKDVDLQPNKLYWEYRFGGHIQKKEELLRKYPFSFFSSYIFEKEGFSEKEWWDLVFSNSGSVGFREDELSYYEDLIPETVLKEVSFRYSQGERSYSNLLRISSLLMKLQKGIKARLYAGFLLDGITKENFSEESIVKILFNFWPTPYDEIFGGFNFGKNENRLLMYSLVHRESAFQPNAISSAGAIGLTQVMPSTALGVLRSLHMDASIEEVKILLKEPSLNFLVGSTYLDEMLEKYNGDIVAALFAYNAGSSRVDSWLDRIDENEYEDLKDPLRILEIPLSEPRIYTRSILTNLFMYQRLDGYALE